MKATELCADIAATLPSLFECSPAPVEGIRVRTPLIYPDGTVVDVFVLERGDTHLITDFGEALGWLQMQSASIRRSRKQQLMVDDICQTLGIELDRGQLSLRCSVETELGEAVLRMGQAVARVTDLWYTLRNQALQTMTDEIDEWLHEKQINFKRAVHRPGRSGRNWTIDFHTRTNERSAFVFLLRTGTRGTVRRMTEHVLAGCVDLSHFKASEPDLVFVSLFDDTEDVWRPEDFRLLENHTEIAQWSRPDVVKRILTTPMTTLVKANVEEAVLS